VNGPRGWGNDNKKVVFVDENGDEYEEFSDDEDGEAEGEEIDEEAFDRLAEEYDDDELGDLEVGACA
jgi:hypothetical protein